MMVKAGESVLIEYSYSFPVFEGKEAILDTNDKTIKIFQTALFVVRDSLAKMYFWERNVIFHNEISS